MYCPLVCSPNSLFSERIPGWVHRKFHPLERVSPLERVVKKILICAAALFLLLGALVIDCLLLPVHLICPYKSSASHRVPRIKTNSLTLGRLKERKRRSEVRQKQTDTEPSRSPRAQKNSSALSAL